MQMELDELKKGKDILEWKIETWEEEARKNNLIVFGLEKRNGERNEDTMKLVEQFATEKMGGKKSPGSYRLC
jgi:hypothetical protein